MIEKSIHQTTPLAKEPDPSWDARQPRIYATALSTPLQGTLFEIAPDSNFANLIDFACQLADFAPKLLDSIANDLNAHGLAEKQKRLEHKRWIDEQSGELINVPADTTTTVPALTTGRPRIEPLCVLVFLMLRGWLGGCKDERFQTATKDSISLRIFLENRGKSLPAGNTLQENLNAVSNQTRHEMHCAELALALDEELDDFEMLRGDSTSVHSSSAYPTDSRTLTRLLCRMCRRLEKLKRLDLEPCDDGRLATWQEELNVLSYRIGTLTSSSAKEADKAAQKEQAINDLQIADSQPDTGKMESAKKRMRRELYEQLYVLGEAIMPELEEHFHRVKRQIDEQQCSPQQQIRREQFLKDFAEDIENTSRGIEQSRGRVCEGKRPSATGRMPLSVSDPPASFIEKGGWEHILGYRPQLGFSRNNFVSALLAPKGNASDQSQFIPLVKAHIANTSVVPHAVSADDGYTGKEQYKECLALGVETVSFSGARGKALLGEEKWESEAYQQARRARNGAESGIFALKHNVGFGQLSSAGMERVRGELLEKVLAYNGLKTVELRKRKYEKETKLKWRDGMPGERKKAA